MRKYEHLAQSIRRKHDLKNRIMMVAMHHLYTENGLPTPVSAILLEEGGRRLRTGGGGCLPLDGYGAKASTMSPRRQLYSRLSGFYRRHAPPGLQGGRAALPRRAL